MNKNPFQEVLNHFHRKKQTDPKLEATFQHLKTQLPPVPPGQATASEQQLRAMFRMAFDYGLKIKAERNPHLMRTARMETYNLCPDCVKRSQTPQNEQEKPNPYQLRLDYSLQQRASQQALRRTEEHSIRRTILEGVPTGDITPDITQQKTMCELPSVKPAPPEQELPHILAMQEPEIEDQWLLNSTPVEMPVVEESDGETETGLPALVAHLKHISKKTA